ncbi:MAG: DUF4301 family protein [Cyclobacteriaceae bacterium]
MFSPEDKKFINSRGSSLATVEKQIDFFKSGFPPLPLEKPAVQGHGIKVVASDDMDKYMEAFDGLTRNSKIVKFVPASGAASRMFKLLFSFMDSYTGSDTDYKKMLEDQSDSSVFGFFKHLEKFAFYDDLKAAHQKLTGETLEESHVKREYVTILKSLLSEEGLDYGSLPKGLLRFHKYDDYNRTPVEEHLVEGAHYAKDKNGKVAIHFTVSPEHKEKFKSHIEEVRPQYEDQFGVQYEISFSEQKASTDTIAVEIDNLPFREDDGTLLFRPAGHGALIENLNELEADVAIIKNIDNVVPDHLKAETYTYKKIIAGLLSEYQQKIFHYLQLLDHGVTEELASEIALFVENELCVELNTGANNKEDLVKVLRAKLDRPIRVCGMVKNEGDTGGGPFWARNSDGSVSLQVVETAQINLDDPDQKLIFDQATHFNPVDLVCSLKNYKGESFDLLKYRDPMTGFITQKSKSGRDLKAQELPGLWNGAMSDWNTIFVPVPLITFNPVKAVNDLLKPQHQ